MERIDEYKQILKGTGRKDVDNLIIELEKMGFFEAPASAVHQNNYRSGLMEHSLSVYKWALILRKVINMPDREKNEKFPLDSIAIVSLLHDVCKSDVYTFEDHDKRIHSDFSNFPCGHGEKSVVILLRLGFELTDMEILGIRWHMGLFEAKSDSQEDKNRKAAELKYPLISLIQKADGLAASYGSPLEGDILPKNLKPATDMITWDSESWINQFNHAVALSEPCRRRELHKVRAKVFQNTLEIIKNGRYRTNDNKEIELDLSPTIFKDSVFVSEEIKEKTPLRQYKTDIKVIGQDCLSVAKELVFEYGNDKVSVLNMASSENPGGGVLRGAGAQEEYLFRCSDYYRSLYQYAKFAADYDIPKHPRHRYPLNAEFGGVFSKGVTVFRGTEAEGYPLVSPWKVNFIAVAANRRSEMDKKNNPRLTPNEISLFEKKVRTILRIAVRNEQKILVLGALGCGAFGNPSRQVAEIFKSVINEAEFSGDFKAIYFAIVDDHNSTTNFKDFAEVFK